MGYGGLTTKGKYNKFKVIKNSYYKFPIYIFPFQLHKSFDNLVAELLDLLSKDIAENIKSCSQYFWLLHMYTQMVFAQLFNRLLLFKIEILSYKYPFVYTVINRYSIVCKISTLVIIDFLISGYQGVFTHVW